MENIFINETTIINNMKDIHENEQKYGVLTLIPVLQTLWELETERRKILAHE